MAVPLDGDWSHKDIGTEQELIAHALVAPVRILVLHVADNWDSRPRRLLSKRKDHIGMIHVQQCSLANRRKVSLIEHAPRRKRELHYSP